MHLEEYPLIQNDPGAVVQLRREQRLRLQRLLIGSVSYLFTLILVLIFWQFGYFPGVVVLRYAAIIASLNLLFFGLTLSGLNLRFSDPSMTLAQVTLSMPTGLYAMYYAQDARGVFLLLCVSAVMYGLFQFRLRDFVILTATLIFGYVALIVSLRYWRPQELHLKVEILQLIALAFALTQFSILGAYIGMLRRNVKEKNQELNKRNGDLEGALARIEQLAIRDELTGVYNRRYLMEVIRMERQRCERSGRTFSIGIIDVDFFKKVNDTYGHLAGDEVLRQIATTAAAALRQTDYFGRYGGEEFAFVLTDTLVEGALITAERVRTQIESLRFPDISPHLVVTVSTGLADSRTNEDTNQTFQAADSALYRAKENGRNRCVIADTQTPRPPAT